MDRIHVQATRTPFPTQLVLPGAVAATASRISRYSLPEGMDEWIRESHHATPQSKTFFAALGSVSPLEISAIWGLPFCVCRKWGCGRGMDSIIWFLTNNATWNSVLPTLLPREKTAKAWKILLDKREGSCPQSTTIFCLRKRGRFLS